MPLVRSVQTSNNNIQISDRNGVKNLDAVLIPSTMNTVAKAENWINTVWIPANITDYQAQVHVFSINPLVCTVGTFRLGDSIPNNWWDI